MTTTGPVPATMRAVWIDRFGGNEVLRCGERPTPRTGARQVLIEVHAASVNPRDWMIRDGTYLAKAMLPKLPFVLGSDVAGVVVGHGDRLDAEAPTTPRLGARVFAMQPSSDGFGAFAEYAAVRAQVVVPMPEGTSFVAAAATPLTALTALQALRNAAGLVPGMRVAILGASGGVGTFAVQIARALGAAEVIGVASAANEELVRSLGAGDFVDYRTRSPTDSIRDVDIVFDVIAKHSLAACAPMLRPGGVYVTTIPGPRAAWDSLRTHLLGLVARSSRQSRMVIVRSNGDDLRRIAAWMADGSLRPVLDRTAPLDQAGDLLEHNRTFRSRGKNVLVVRP